jgi:hypothetical protein
MSYKWEVHRDGKCIMGTNTDECFYPTEVLKQMISLGWKIYKEGKIFKISKENKNNG